MILEVNDAGEILIPAELVRAAPRELLTVEREGDLLVLKPKGSNGPSLVETLPVIPGRMIDDDFTFRREDIYNADSR